METSPSPEGPSLTLSEDDQGATSQTLVLKVFRTVLGVQHLEKLLDTGVGFNMETTKSKTPT